MTSDLDMKVSLPPRTSDLAARIKALVKEPGRSI